MSSARGLANSIHNKCLSGVKSCVASCHPVYVHSPWPRMTLINDLLPFQPLLRHKQPGDRRDLVQARRGLPQGGPQGLRLLHPLRRGREEDQGDGHARHHGRPRPAEDARRRRRTPGTKCIKIGLPGKLILSKRKGLREIIFS